MKITYARLEYQAFTPDDLKASPLPEIAFLGRSNVGKSSTINCLAHRHRLAWVSKRPGHTRGLFFYCINHTMMWVDFPGYGYARRPKTERMRWRGLAEHYLRSRPNLRGVVLILDARHAPTERDQQMVQWLMQAPRPTLVLLNKADLVSHQERRQRQPHLQDWAEQHGLHQVLWFSARTGEGRTAALTWIRNLCREEEPP